MIKQLFALILSAFVIITPALAFADSSCSPIFGGGSSCTQTGSVQIISLVQNPQDKSLVNSLSSDNEKTLFVPGQNVSLVLQIQNTSKDTINDVEVRDVLPRELEFVSGTGSYDPSTHTFTSKISKLQTTNANKSQSVDLVARVSQEKLPAKPGTVCVVNQGFVTAINTTNQSNSTFCIKNPGGNVAKNQTATPSKFPTQTKGGQAVFPAPQTQKTPGTGPEMLALIGLVPVGAFGQFLRKKAKA